MARHTIAIARPVGDVFDVLTDVTLTGRWYPAEVEEWWTTPPPHGVGSIRRARVMLLGRASENEAVVTEFEPPHRAAMRGLSRSAPFEVTLTFEPEDGETRVTVDSQLRLTGLLRLVGPVFIGRYERSWDRGLQNVKRLMESGELIPRGADVAPDGSPVAFYRRLPATGEPELIASVVPPGSTILDLGCGPGRIAGPLAAMGYRVTGIDNGAGMVAALPPDVEGIVADATTVRLGRRFDAVLLASHLVNDPENGVAFARTAAAHVVDTGVVIGETYPPGWDPAPSVGQERRLGDATVRLERAHLDGDLLSAEVRYGVDGAEWSQPFTARVLDEAGLGAVLEEAGLTFDGWLDRPGWFVARPAPELRPPAR